MFPHVFSGFLTGYLFNTFNMLYFRLFPYVACRALFFCSHAVAGARRAAEQADETQHRCARTEPRRRSEILGLRWEHVDFEHQCFRLPDSKTGAKIVYLNAPALTLLSELPRVENNPHVIAGTREGAASKAIDKVWDRVRKGAELPGVRLHDLRHSFASVGAIGGFSLPIIGALLGHKHSMTTARYAHLSADPIRAANEAVGARIAAAMSNQSREVVVFAKQKKAHP